uniref:Uncharacterized protein n=1 Tax=Arundo donax TaxID=35708 RepID=A0A0A9CPC8_ARUDO
MRAAAVAPPPAALLSRCSAPLSSAPRLLFSCSRAPGAACRPPQAVARSVSVSVEAPAAANEPATAGVSAVAPRRRLILLRHGESAAGGRATRDHDRPLSKAGRSDAISVSNKLQQMGWIPELILSRCIPSLYKRICRDLSLFMVALGFI